MAARHRQSYGGQARQSRWRRRVTLSQPTYIIFPFQNRLRKTVFYTVFKLFCYPNRPWR